MVVVRNVKVLGLAAAAHNFFNVTFLSFYFLLMVYRKIIPDFDTTRVTKHFNTSSCSRSYVMWNFYGIPWTNRQLSMVPFVFCRTLMAEHYFADDEGKGVEHF